jgi:hypothetical protein
MTQDKTAYEGQPTHESSGMSHPSMATSPVLEYTERVEALHECKEHISNPSCDN